MITILPVVATVLTVYGIETSSAIADTAPIPKLQQYLPFTVLKRVLEANITPAIQLQQYLPFTVLKHTVIKFDSVR